MARRSAFSPLRSGEGAEGLIIGKVKEGRAVISEAATDPEVVSKHWRRRLAGCSFLSKVV